VGHWETGVLCATAWYRNLPSNSREAVTRYLVALKDQVEVECTGIGVDMSIRIDLVSGDQEAGYEKRAVDYALQRSGLDRANLVLSGGSGSMQICRLGTRDDAAVASIDVDLSRGEEQAGDKQAFNAWKKAVEKAFDECDDIDKLTDGGTIFKDEKQARDFAEKLKTGKPKTFCLAAISGTAYAADAAGLIIMKGNKGTWTYLKMVDVLAKFEEFIETLEQKQPLEDRERKNMANITRLVIVLKRIMEKFKVTNETTEILFCRDWDFSELPPPQAKATSVVATSGDEKAEGGAPSAAEPKLEEKFRTTWTAGWWLAHLSEKKPKLPLFGVREGGAAPQPSERRQASGSVASGSVETAVVTQGAPLSRQVSGML